MNKNVGGIDKTVRIIAGVIILSLGIISESLWGLIGIIPLLTGIIEWCPLYIPFKINSSCKNEDKN